MAVNTRTNGANARQIDWNDDIEEQAAARRGRSGRYLQLDALTDDEQVYTSTPQLRAMPRHATAAYAQMQAAAAAQAQAQAQAVPRRPLFGFPVPQREAVAPTRAHPTSAQTQVQAQPQAPTVLNEKVVQARSVAIIAALGIGALALYVVVSMFLEWSQVKLDDLQYGRPRTMQIDAYVGHGETDGAPSHFVAMNLNRRVTILEMPGGDSTKVNTIVGPYLFGQGEDLTPVQVGVQDLNADGKADLVVAVKNEQLLYMNDGANFKLATPEERAAIEKALARKANASTKVETAPQSAAPNPGSGAPEVGK